MKKRIFISCLALLALVCFTACAQAEEGYTAAPDMENWGVQDNNGWYYLRTKDQGETYEQMPFYLESDIGWQAMAFASDPGAEGEMYFIGKASFFLGELGTRPAYAYLAPADGRVEVRFYTHGQEDMRLSVFLDGAPIREDIAFNTTGAHAGFTLHAVRMDVKAGQWIYLTGSSAGANREGWVKDYSILYLAPDAPLEVDEEEASQAAAAQEAQKKAADPGALYAPDPAAFGAQGNNGWYYLYKTTAGEYLPMPFWASSDIAWQAGNFASDPGAMGEMFFISPSSCFTGELGTLPVYAFQAPVGGDVEISALTHGAGGAAVRLVKDGETVPLNDQEWVTLTTDGPEGGFTALSAKVAVEKGDWLYLEVFTAGTGREGWIKELKARYLSYNGRVNANYPGKVYAPDHEDGWGAANNNGWSYMFLDKETGTLRKLAFVRSEDIFRATEDAKYSYLMIMRGSVHPSLGGSPAMVFTAPHAGSLTLTAIARIGAYDLSPTSTGLAVWLNGEKVWPATEDFHKLSAETCRLALPLSVAEGDQVAVIVDALNENINYDETVLQVLAEYAAP